MDFDELQEEESGQGAVGDHLPAEEDYGSFGFDDKTVPGATDEEAGGVLDFNADGAAAITPSGSTSFFGFFGKGLKMAFFKWDAADEIASDPKAFIPALLIFMLPSFVIGLVGFAMLKTLAPLYMESSGLPAAQMAAIEQAAGSYSYANLIFPELEALALSLVWVGLMFLFAKLMRGEGGFLDHYQTVGVGSLVHWLIYPSFLLIPFTGIYYLPLVFLIWAILVSVMATSRVHRLGVPAALASSLLSVIIIVGAFAAYAYYQYLSFMEKAAAAGMGGMQGM